MFFCGFVWREFFFGQLAGNLVSKGDGQVRAHRQDALCICPYEPRFAIFARIFLLLNKWALGGYPASSPWLTVEAWEARRVFFVVIFIFHSPDA